MLSLPQVSEDFAYALLAPKAPTRQPRRASGRRGGARRVLGTGVARAAIAVARWERGVRTHSPYRFSSIIARQIRCAHFRSRGLSCLCRFVPNFEVCTILGGFGTNLGSESALIGSAVLSLPQAHEVVWGVPVL